MNFTGDSILDHPAISGRYLFPQDRSIDDPFKVNGAELACCKKKLSGYRNPLLVMHTENDGLIDISHAERNHKWASSTQKQLVRFAAGSHNKILGRNWEEYLAAVGGFVKLIRGGAAISK